MSRNDTYLSLCLEQASLSPLHYRHGCIIVRGGKVIGKGYNDYRSGYNGGAQTTGQLSSAVAHKEIAINDPKPKNPKSYSSAADSIFEVASKNKKSARNYVAFDSQNHAVGTGGSCLANTPLSMHSEMMAINSALSLSSTVACQGTARSTQCNSKRTPMPSAQTRRGAKPPRSAVASLAFNSLVLKPLQSNLSQHYVEDYYIGEEEEKEEKNESKRQNKGSNYVHHHAQINSLKFQKANFETSRQPTNENNEKHRNQYLYGIQDTNQSHRHSSRQEGQRTEHSQQRHKSSALVVPQNRLLGKSHRVAERMKDSRLNGADLYVARLGRVGKANHFDCGCQYEKPGVAEKAREHEQGSRQALSDPSGSSNETKPVTGSLHDELRFPLPGKSQTPRPRSDCIDQQVNAIYSRPCYRCISYMHSAGIKRVFWTNVKGEWECGKVRDLVDALEDPKSTEDKGSKGISGAGSVYVTKSEVLILKGLR